MSDVLELVMPRRLATPNLTLWKHWSEKRKHTEVWRAELQAAVMQVPRWQEWILVSFEMRRDPKTAVYQPIEIRKAERRRVTVIRQVRFRHHFIRDDDNLRFATKPLNDALTRIGLLYDDSREWLEQAMPLQEVSPDKKPRTIVRLERIQEDRHGA